MATKKSRAKKSAPLERYQGKRNFSKTPEPAAAVAKKSGWSFVVQEHHARALHYDFRLEMDGVLVSWAVPKGVPETLEPRRLAVHVEDHPLAYGKFAGTIPEGNYGAGTVNIWDSGTWEPMEPNWEREFKKGKMKFVLHGGRLEGPYLLARMKEEPNWLLRKLDPATHPDAPLAKPEKETAAFVPPQLTRPVTTVPTEDDWIHELKFDGYRLIAVRQKKKVRLFTRNELDWTARFQPLADALEKLPGGDYVLDGEAVVFDAKGRPSFSGLQDALKNHQGKGISFVAFDILHLSGKNLRRLPLEERLKYLTKVVDSESGNIRRSKIWPAAGGPALFEEACRIGLEGIISKKRSGPYQSEQRRDWTKSKCRPRQEFVICGYTAPRQTCPAFGALVLASFENNKLVPRGKVGTGFTDAQRRTLLKTMSALKSKTPTLPEKDRTVTWIKPSLVAEIEYAELTSEGSIRQGSFIALREDKPSEDVHLDAVDHATAKTANPVVAHIKITHPDRIVYADPGVPKLEVGQYYESVADHMLPHLIRRPLALLRAPDGVDGPTFFQKSFKEHVPPNVTSTALKDGTDIVEITNLKGLISLVQYGVIEFHPWGATTKDPERPDHLVWDFDPDKSVDWREVLGAAVLLRNFLAEEGLETIVKTSGGKGIHVVLPLRRHHDWEVLKPFTSAVAAAVAEKNPDRLTVVASLAKRKQKIYIDWLRNGRGSTCVAPWSLRARPGAKVSMPLNWSELKGLEPQGFSLREPPHFPSEWEHPKAQSIPASLLRKFA